MLRHFNAVFLLTVVAPTLLAAGYYGTLASDVYISESRFVVRSPQRQNQTGLGALLQGSGFTRSQDDTYSVHDFVRSRDALSELDGKMEVRKAFSDKAIDLFNRFPGLDGDASAEAFYKHYLKHIDITYDSASSISVLRVRAYQAKDAAGINEMLLQMGERLVNNLNTRSRKDLIDAAELEVRQAEDRSKIAAQSLASFRADRGVFDPDRQGAIQLAGTAKLREELLAAESQLAQVKQLSPNNPQVPSLQTRVDLLRKAVQTEDSRLLGRESGLTTKSPVYDRLQLERVFADRQLAAALTALDAARSEAARKQLYLERLVQPHLPDSAVEPRRARSIFNIFMLGLVAWGIVALVVASVREHAD
jgi:capsular polysaccharide transport system permease protein